MKLRLDINSGGYGLIWVVGFFGVLLFTKYSQFVGQNVIGLEFAWTTGLAAQLTKRGHNNKLSLEADKAKLCDGNQK